jgi:hypothetical protein
MVGTLGEMDPIDDRLMQKKEQQGGCLLGYNTNGGVRIDVKLRTDDLQGFRPYLELGVDESMMIACQSLQVTLLGRNNEFCAVSSSYTQHSTNTWWMLAAPSLTCRQPAVR